MGRKTEGKASAVSGVYLPLAQVIALLAEATDVKFKNALQFVGRKKFSHHVPEDFDLGAVARSDFREHLSRDAHPEFKLGRVVQMLVVREPDLLRADDALKPPRVGVLI